MIQFHKFTFLLENRFESHFRILSRLKFTYCQFQNILLPCRQFLTLPRAAYWAEECNWPSCYLLLLLSNIASASLLLFCGFRFLIQFSLLLQPRKVNDWDGELSSLFALEFPASRCCCATLLSPIPSKVNIPSIPMNRDSKVQCQAIFKFALMLRWVLSLINY